MPHKQLGKSNPNWKGGEIKVSCLHCNRDKFVRRYRGLQDKNHFCNFKCYGLWQKKEGRRLNSKIRDCAKRKNWRELVKKKANYKCEVCGSSDKLEAHHKVPLRELLKDIQDFLLAFEKKEIWDITNGISLCVRCHANMDTYRENTLQKE